MRYEENSAVATLATVAFDRVEKLTGSLNKVRNEKKDIEKLVLDLASTRNLLQHIAINMHLIQKDADYAKATVDSIQLELRKG